MAAEKRNCNSLESMTIQMKAPGNKNRLKKNMGSALQI